MDKTGNSSPRNPLVAMGMAFAFFLAAGFSVVCAIYGIREPLAMAVGYFAVGCLSMWWVYQGSRKSRNQGDNRA